MITIKSPVGDVTVRTDRPDEVRQALSRRVRTTHAGIYVIEGDGGWDPATLTLTVRVSDPTDASAVTAWRALLASARAATALTLHDSEVDVLGTPMLDSEHRGTYWIVRMQFLPAAIDSARGLTPVSVGGPFFLAAPGVTLDAAPGVALAWKDDL